MWQRFLCWANWCHKDRYRAYPAGWHEEYWLLRCPRCGKLGSIIVDLGPH